MAVGHAEAEIERAFAGDSDLLCDVIAAGVQTISRPDRSIDCLFLVASRGSSQAFGGGIITDVPIFPDEDRDRIRTTPLRPSHTSGFNPSNHLTAAVTNWDMFRSLREWKVAGNFESANRAESRRHLCGRGDRALGPGSQLGAFLVYIYRRIPHRTD